MKTGIRIKRYALIALWVVLVSLGVSLAFVSYRHYGIIARGISGVVLMYLLFYFGKHSQVDVSIDALLLDPKKGKYLISAFIVPLISYWATAQIFEMILFFTK
jgi:hypothetical protein